MTLRMQLRATRWGDFTDVDLPAIGAGQFVLSISYSHPTRLSWTCLVPQHEPPLAQLSYIRVWIEGANDPAGEPFSAENPVFEGYIENVAPGTESIGVTYEALDPTYRATKMVTIFSAAWPAGTPPDSPPLPPETGVPQLIYNCRITADPDWAIQVGGDGTLAQVIAGLLEFCYHPLVWCDAAPGNGVDVELAYDFDELFAAATVKPQEKLDFQAESVRSGIERVQRYDPRLRLFWEPGSRLWRVRNITSAPTRTLTLNRRDVDFPVLSLTLKRSTEQCVTAVSIYGPPVATGEEFLWLDPVDPTGTASTSTAELGLQPLGDPILLQNYSTGLGMFDARMWTAFQVIDPAKRRSARQLPDFYPYQKAPTIFGQTEYPLLLCSWDRGRTWLEWYPVWFDYLNGIVNFIGTPPFFVRQNQNGHSLIPGSTQTHFCPNALKLIWAPFAAPLKVRRPETGYEGTAFTQAGLMVEDFQFDEALSIGREYGIPVTSAERRAAFNVYAQTLLDQRKDVVWTGGAQLDGLDWNYCRLHKRCRIVAEDGSGNTLDTGWDDVQAYVTDVEYDLEDQTTTLTFSADKLALFGIDQAQLKAQLNIRPLRQVVDLQTRFLYATRRLPSGKAVSEVVGVETTPQFSYVDPET